MGRMVSTTGWCPLLRASRGEYPRPPLCKQPVCFVRVKLAGYLIKSSFHSSYLQGRAGKELTGFFESSWALLSISVIDKLGENAEPAFGREKGRLTPPLICLTCLCLYFIKLSIFTTPGFEIYFRESNEVFEGNLLVLGA